MSGRRVHRGRHGGSTFRTVLPLVTVVVVCVITATVVTLGLRQQPPRPTPDPSSSRAAPRPPVHLQKRLQDIAASREAFEVSRGEATHRVTTKNAQPQRVV